MKAFALTIALSSLITPAVYAAVHDAGPQEVVRFADLDTHTAAGAATLYRRIHAAALDVCAYLDRGSPADLMIVRLYKDCIRTAMTSAIEGVNAPALTGYASQQGLFAPTLASAR